MIEISALEFIKIELINFTQQFQKTKVKVEYDMGLSSYYLEVIPSEIYHFNDSYISWETDFLNKFIQKFPEENIFFITDDSVITLDNVNFEITGSDFIQSVNINPVYTTTDLIINIFSNNELQGIPNLNLHPNINLAIDSIFLNSNSTSIPVEEIDYLEINLKNSKNVSDELYTLAA